MTTVYATLCADHYFRGPAVVRQEPGNRFVVEADYGGANCSYWDTYQDARHEAARLFVEGAVSELRDFVAQQEDQMAANKLAEAEAACRAAGLPVAGVS